MGLIKLLWDLYYFPRHHESTPAPDDWPPDGSLHLIDFTKYTQRHISDSFVQYEFFSNIGEGDRRIIPLSIDIMKRFCGSRQVLTQIYSSWELLKKEKHPPERFPVRYRRFLEHIGAPVSINAPDEKTLLLLEEGFDPTAFWVGQDISTVDGCFFDFYVLPENLPISSAKNAKEIVISGQYDVWFDLNEWGPCALYLTLNPETVDVAALQEIVAAVCKEHNILFQNPPKC